MGQIDEIVIKARKYCEELGYTVDKVNFTSNSVTVECSLPPKIEKIIIIWGDE